MNQKSDISKKRGHWSFLLLLVITATWIWMRDRSWVEMSADSLSIIIVFPLAWYLSKPLHLDRQICLAAGWHYGSLSVWLIPAALLALGILMELTLLLAISWSWAFYVFLKHYYKSRDVPFERLLLLLPWAFPWLALDASFIGWWFRISGAWITEKLFLLLGLDVVREGSFILVQQMPVSVEAACSGLNLLQSLMIGGTFLVLMLIRGRKGLVLAVISLPVMAWLANTARIILITTAGLTFSVETASGLFHTWGALLVIMIMMLITWQWCILIGKFANRRGSE